MENLYSICFVQHFTGGWRAAVVDARQTAVEQIIPKLLDLRDLPHRPLTDWIEVRPGQKKVWLDRSHLQMPEALYQRRLAPVRLRV
jgi:hypothetical protein